MKIVALFIEVIGWVLIAAAPFLAGVCLGLLLMASVDGLSGIIGAGFLSFTGLVAGGILATRIWKKKGTIQFLSEIMSTHDVKDNGQKSE